MKRTNKKSRRAQMLARDQLYGWLMILLSNRRWINSLLQVRGRSGACYLRNHLAAIDDEAAETRRAIGNLDAAMKSRGRV